MESQLKKEIQDLKSQIENFEAAIIAIQKPSGTLPTGSSLVDALVSRFDKLDNDVEKQKSLQTAKTFLEDVKSRLQEKE